MAAYAALVSLLNNIHTIINHPGLSTSLDNEQIQPLVEKTNFLLNFIEGSSYGGGSKEAQDLERKIASAAHAAEDVIESHIVDQIHAANDLTEEADVEPYIANQIHAAKDLIESNTVDQIHTAKDLIESHIVNQIHAAKDLIESHTVDQTHAVKDLIESHIVDQIHAAKDLIEPKIVDQIHATKDIMESYIVDQIHAAKDMTKSLIVDRIRGVEDLTESHIVDQIRDMKDLTESYIADHIHAAKDVIESHIVDQIHAAKDLIESHAVDQIHLIKDQTHEERTRRPSFFKFLLECVGCHIRDKSETSHGRQIKEDMDATTIKASEFNELKEKSRLGKEQLLTHLARSLTVNGETATVGIHRSEKPLDLRHIIEDMDAIVEDASEFRQKHRLGEEQLPTHLAEARMKNGETTMVGLDAELNQLLDELTGYQSSRRIISVVGMGGTGKTTLVKNVYDNLLIKESFQFRAWATISQPNNTKESLLKLLSGLGEFRNKTVDDLGQQLHKTLSGRRYLIVIDDIWNVVAWDEVKRFFPDNNNGSRILLTTRLSNVAKDCGSSLFMMNLLDEANSWKLFCKKAFEDENCPPELQEAGEEIVKLCKGLALSIVVVGGLLLNSPSIVGYWRSVANDLKATPNPKEKQESLDILCLSYNHLPPHLKPCFLYMGVFKEDSEIRVSKIIRLWVAEGFIKPIGSRVLEEIAEGYLKDLIDRNLILVRGCRKNGKVGSCSIHDLLRDLCLKLAEEEEFFHLTKGGIRGTKRRLVDNKDVERTEVKLPLTRSIMTQGCLKSSVEYRLLRILDEDGVDSQANYYANVNLRYISHSIPNYAKSQQKLPTSLSAIWNLQTLVIKNVERLISVPVEIWKLRQLRHVVCYKMYIPEPPQGNRQDGSLMLENLLTLNKIVNLRLSEEVCRIIPNIKKLHLAYFNYDQGYDDGLIEYLCNLDHLQNLESLNLKITTVPPAIAYRRLQKKLIASLPRTLKKLSLGHYILSWIDMKVIGLLPQLEVLELDHLSIYWGGQWSPANGQFLRLKFLKIESCDLYCWDADNSHFPILEKLHLLNLYYLEEIPLGIGDIPTLQLIRVDCCSASATVSAVRIKEDQLDNDNQLQVQVKVWRKYLESFNQMLETEGLTTDHIQLGYWG